MGRERIPYFRFYPTDFMGGVRGMTAQEVGLYMMLLCRMYEENGPIESHSLRLATYCGMRVATFEATLSKLIALGKITSCGGMLFNERAEREIASRANDLKIASEAGKASAEKRQKNQRQPSTPVQRPFNHTDADTDKKDANASYARASDPDHFEAFWQQYPHRGGAKKGKATARKAWDKAIKARASPEQIIGGAMRYAGDAQVLRGYAKDPATWINAKGWQDDVEQERPAAVRPISVARAFDRTIRTVAAQIATGTVRPRNSDRDPLALLGGTGQGPDQDEYLSLPVFRPGP